MSYLPFIEELKEDKIKLEAENARLQEQFTGLVKNLESLTPGGSEFHNDPDRCIDFLKHLPKMNIKFKLRIKELEEQNIQAVFATELLVKELNALKENITNSWRETTSDPPEITISP